MHHFEPCLHPSARRDTCEASFLNSELSVPMQIKYIADPSMHSIPAVAVHPSKQWFIGTSLDNQIVTYAAKDRFRQNRKKVFKVSAHRMPRKVSPSVCSDVGCT